MSLPKFEYLRAETKEEVCSLLSQYEEAKVVAGGTDILVQMKMRTITPPYLIGLKNIPDWDTIEGNGKGLRIGALTTLHAVENSSLVREKFPLLAQVAHQMATPHIRRMGTIGGNICQMVSLNRIRRSLRIMWRRSCPLKQTTSNNHIRL